MLQSILSKLLLFCRSTFSRTKGEQKPIPRLPLSALNHGSLLHRTVKQEVSPEGVYKHEMSSSVNIKHEIPPPESLSSDVQITIVAPPRIERVKTEPKEQMVQQMY